MFMEKHCATAAVPESRAGCTREEQLFCTAVIVYYCIPVHFNKNTIFFKYELQIIGITHAAARRLLGAYPRSQHSKGSLLLDGVFS